MTRPLTSLGISTQIRQFVEEYTPDGTAGRLGLATVTGLVGGCMLWLAAVGVVIGTAFSTLLLTPITAIGFFLCLVLTVLTLWPVYLSAIGRVESPSEYSNKVRKQSLRSPTEQLKQEYQKGSLSEDDLEQELEAVLNRSSQPDPKRERDQPTHDDHQLEDPDLN